MSIVERMAELLGPGDPRNAKPASRDGAAQGHGPDLIERAVSELGTEPAHAEGPAVHSGIRASAGRSSAGRAQAARRVSRAVKIDLAHLRRQGIVTPDSARTPIGESLRRIKRHILSQAVEAPSNPLANLVLVTSALAGEGKTFCAVNLAISIALEMDHTVLLVDADVAKPSVPRVLGVDTGQGLMDVLLDSRLDLSEVLCRTDIDKLSLLSAGTPHRRATELLASDAMRRLLGELAARYRDRIIIFDSPPLLAASEAAALAAQVGQIVMVVEAGRTTEVALGHALRLVESGNVALLLNKGDARGLGYGYGYGY